MSRQENNRENTLDYKNIIGEDSMNDCEIVEYRMSLLEEFQSSYKGNEEYKKRFDKNKRGQLKKLAIANGIDVKQSIPARIASRIGLTVQKWDREAHGDKTVFQYFKKLLDSGEINFAQFYTERVKYGDFKIGVYGNKKISKEFFCLNAESALNCSSNACGDCTLGEQCYARAIEGRFNGTYLKNELMRFYWATSSAKEIAEDIVILGANKTSHYIQGVRFNVNGDFTNQEVLDKASEIAERLIEYNIVCYGYTHRTKLNLDSISPHLVVNGSTNKVPTDTKFLAVEEAQIPSNAENLCPCASDNEKQCGIDCCMCMAGDGRVIYEKLRGTSPKELKEFM